jgi:6-carboxyhexanoate--CoA ligase
MKIHYNSKMKSHAREPGKSRGGLKILNNLSTSFKKGENPLWSIRMRASMTVGAQIPYRNHRPPCEVNQGSIHISGAEGIYTEKDIGDIIGAFTQRALHHPRGEPDEVIITIERITDAPLIIPLLYVSTRVCDSLLEARTIAAGLLSHLGITQEAIGKGFGIVTGKRIIRGAALVLAKSGGRVDPEKKRGIRVSRLGISDAAEKGLSRRLARSGIDNTTVKEAIILASKVASCDGIIAELCISDDPDYTTGYVASRQTGYIRIPCIKPEGTMEGGRVFFVEEKADIKGIIEYLERRPVIAGR